ncbi:hypothetical protein KIN20_000883 [Parelaphostrongylus tenuis]|uniref:Uncharacterized protein n=1 Tax=Parelaphostrongylus tenuis TaxID=148309 RepID=A0AAD5QGG5_PARTN|nr:hypothetical protein KIN20_000883 [Parelaphostrongylus tenuis]
MSLKAKDTKKMFAFLRMLSAQLTTAWLEKFKFLRKPFRIRCRQCAKPTDSSSLISPVLEKRLAIFIVETFPVKLCYVLDGFIIALLHFHLYQNGVKVAAAKQTKLKGCVVIPTDMGSRPYPGRGVKVHTGSSIVCHLPSRRPSRSMSGTRKISILLNASKSGPVGHLTVKIR